MPDDDLRGTWKPKDRAAHGEGLVVVAYYRPIAPSVLFSRAGKVWVLPRAKFLELFERERPS